jgi:hypothetical protein
MDSPELPHRCPKCNALVVDRRSPVCTTCRAALPAAWVMSPAQAAKLKEIDEKTKAEHLASLRTLDPTIDPNVPKIVRLLDGNGYGYRP